MLQMRRVIFYVAGVVFLVAVALTTYACQQRGGSSAQAREQQIKSILTLGMSEEEVVDSLAKAGIRHSEMVDPTGNGQYFEIHISIVDGFGFLSTWEYVITGGASRLTGNKKAGVIVTLDANGVVTEID